MHVLFTFVLYPPFQNKLAEKLSIARVIKVMKFQLSRMYIDGMSQQNIHVEAKELHFYMVCNMMIVLHDFIFKTALTFP
jgi:hypothetical protein